MAPRRRDVVWSAQAHRALREILEYLAEQSPRASDDFGRRIIDVAESLIELSERGRIIPELGDPGLREIMISPYRVLYRVDETMVSILNIIHDRRNFASTTP